MQVHFTIVVVGLMIVINFCSGIELEIARDQVRLVSLQHEVLGVEVDVELNIVCFKGDAAFLLVWLFVVVLLGPGEGSALKECHFT